MVSGIVMSRGPAGPAGCCLMGLVDALEMAAIAGDGTHAFVIAFERAGDGELAAAAFAIARLLGRGRFDGNDLVADLLCLAFLLIFHLGTAAARLGWCVLGLGFDAARGFGLGMTAGFGVGGFTRFFLGLAALGSGAFRLHLFFFKSVARGLGFGAAAGFGVGDARIGDCRGAARLFLVRQLAQHHAARRRGCLGGGLGRFGGNGGGLFSLSGFFRRLGGRRAQGALLFDHHRLGAAMAEALLDGGCFRLLQRQRFGALGFVGIAHESLFTSSRT